MEEAVAKLNGTWTTHRRVWAELYFGASVSDQGSKSSRWVEVTINGSYLARISLTLPT